MFKNQRGMLKYIEQLFYLCRDFITCWLAASKIRFFLSMFCVHRHTVVEFR